MAYSGRSEDHYRFYRYSTLLMDVGGDTLRLVVKKFCQRDDLTFREFLSKYKDDLFHGRKTQHKCTNCPHMPPLSTGGAFDDDQWKQLYIPDTSYGSSVDVDSTSNSQHDSPQRWKVNPSVELEHLEINLLADILHNVRPVLLFYLHGFMHHYGQTNFESFLNHHKNALYHHYREDKCCLCSPQMKKNNDTKISERQWMILFRKSQLCPLASCSMPVCCTVYSAKSVQEEQLSMNVLSKVLTLTVPVFQLISSIIKKRHTIYAHPRNDTKMDAETFNREWQHLRGLILQLIEEIKHPELKDELENRIENLSSFIPTDKQYNELLDRVEEMEKHENKMYQELNEVKKGQKQIFGEVTRKRTDNMKLIKGRIEDHLKRPRLPTEYIEKGKRILEENGILIFTGISGEGKTWHCLEVLSTLSNQDVVQLDSMRLDITEWDTYVGADRKDIVVWIDDLKAASVQNQKPFFERVQHQISKRVENIYLISSVTNSELERITEYRLNLFKECFIVRLGSKNRREEGFEWRQNFLKTFIHLGISKPESIEESYPVDIVQDVNEENLNSVPFKISVPTLKKIAKINTEIGFPECCRRFFSDPDLFRQGEHFFLFPSRSTMHLLREMATSDEENIRRKFLVLCMVLLFPSNEPHNHLQNNVTKGLLNVLDVRLSTENALKRTFNHLLSSYLIKDSNKAIRFQHDTLRFAVAFILCELDEDASKLFILNGPLDVVLNLCKKEFQHQNQSSSFSFPVDRDIIFHRLVHEMTRNEYRHHIQQIFWHVGTDNPALWTCFMEYVADKEPLAQMKVEKIIKLNISHPAKVFGIQESITQSVGQNNTSKVQDKFLSRILPILNIVQQHVLVILMNDNPSFELDYFFKILCMVTTENYQLLQICSERLYASNFNILEDVILYHSDKDVKNLINGFDHRQNIAMSLFNLAEVLNVHKAYKIRELSLHFASSVPSDDIFSSFSTNILEEINIMRNVSDSAIESLTLPVLTKYISRACREKYIPLLMSLRSVIMNSKEFKDKVLEEASTQTFSSYSLTEVSKIRIDENNCTGVLKFTCKDLEILEMFDASDEHLLKLLKERFLTKEFSYNHVCATFPLLNPVHISENDCCSVEICCPNFDDKKHQCVDCCMIMTEKHVDDSKLGIIIPCFLFSICNNHFADRSFTALFSNDSFEFLKAVEEMELSRISTLAFFTSKLGNYIEEIFVESCKVGSHLMVRHILEEEFEIKEETLTNGLKTSCEKGHSLVVHNLLSWKPGMISQKCLSDCIQTAIENSHSQTMAYILTSEQVTSYLRDGSAKGGDILYCNIREAIRKCDEKYLSRILSSFLSKKTITGIVLVINERYPNPM